MPLSIFRIRLVAAANLGGFLLAGGMYGTFLLLTLYMQQVLHLSVLQTGVAFLATAGTAVLMAGPAQALTTRFGAKPVLIVGMSLLVAGLSLVHADRRRRLVPDGSASGLRRGRHRDPVLVHPDHDRRARRRAAHEKAGLASGLINTSQQVGGAIGTAVLSTVFVTHSRTLLEERTPPERSADPGLRVGLLGRRSGSGPRGCSPRSSSSGARRSSSRPRSSCPPRRAERAPGHRPQRARARGRRPRRGRALLRRSRSGFPLVARSDDRAWVLVGERSRIGLWTPQVGIAGGRGGAHVHYAMHVDAADYDSAVAAPRDAGLDPHEEHFEDNGTRRVRHRPGRQRRRALDAGPARASAEARTARDATFASPSSERISSMSNLVPLSRDEEIRRRLERRPSPRTPPATRAR